MAPVNRAALLGRIQRVLKKHYKPVPAPAGRSVLEHLLFAAICENSDSEAAERVLSSLLGKFFDLNELRVSSVRELTEEMKSLADSEAAAIRLKSILQSVFELQYAFDLEHLKKQNLSAAVKTISKYEGANDFSVAYVTQHGLGGHSIPVNKGAMLALVVVGVLTEKEAATGRVPGLERAISKTKGIEFGSLLQQLGVLVAANPYSPGVRKLLLEIAPGCKDRLPKRPAKKQAAAEKEAAKGKSKAAGRKADGLAKATSAAKKKKSAPSEPAATKKKAASARKKAPAKSTSKGTGKKTAAKKSGRVQAAKKRTKVGSRKKSVTKKLTKRKPR